MVGIIVIIFSGLAALAIYIGLGCMIVSGRESQREEREEEKKEDEENEGLEVHSADDRQDRP